MTWPPTRNHFELDDPTGESYDAEPQSSCLRMNVIDWSDKVAADFRRRIIVDPHSAILAFKANRDRYTQPAYAGLPHLGSQASEDALTWNVFRSLQKVQKLHIICDEFAIGEPIGLLLWTLAPQVDDVSAKLQYEAGMLIRRFDGMLRGQMTEPDVIILGTKGVAVVECKLGEPENPPSHLWEGLLDSVEKRFPIYRQAEPTLLRKDVTDAQAATIYQLVRMAFYAIQLGKSLSCSPVVGSLANERSWCVQIPRLDKSAAELWGFFEYAVEVPNLRKTSTSWQRVANLIASYSLDELSYYLSTHPCL
jgi:hypothetical protein